MSIQLKQLDYVIIYVSDMQRSLAFYRDTLGLTLKFTSPGWTEFVTGTTAIALHVVGMQGEEATPRQSLPPAGQAQIGFMVDDLEATYEALKVQKGVVFSLAPKTQNSGARLAVLHDPDGLGITLQQR
jgi:lactoylglutathione lyase